MNKSRLTRFEYARVLGARALQIALGAPVLIELPPEVDRRDPLNIARYEIEQRAVPIIVVRVYPDGREEHIALLEE